MMGQKAKGPPQFVTPTPGTLDALEARGITPEFVATVGHLVQTAKYESGTEALAFRHRYKKSTTGKKDHWHMRALLEKKFWQSSGTKRSLWNNECLDGNPKKIIMTEGHLDGLSCMQSGYENTTSVPDGAPEEEVENDQTKYAYLDSIDWRHIDNVILAFDGDGPGRALREDVANRIGRARCLYVEWPKGCKDANAVLMKYGEKGVRTCIERAKFVSMPNLRALSDIPIKDPIIPMKTGIAGVDDYWRPAEGHMTILTGIPGNGKTTLTAFLLVNLCKTNNCAVAIASLEDDIRLTLVPRLIQVLAGKPIDQCSVQEQVAAEIWIEEHIIFIDPPDNDDVIADVGWIIDHLEAARIRKKVRMCIVDPWNEIDHTTRPSDVTVTEYTGVMLSRLRRTARRMGFHLVIAAHPTKAKPDAEGKYHAPTGHNIADSAAWMNKPDLGMTVHILEGNMVQITIWKCRFRQIIGEVGTKYFVFDSKTGEYIHDTFYYPKD